VAAVVQCAANLSTPLDESPLPLSPFHLDPNRDLRPAPIGDRTTFGLTLIDLAAS